MTNNWATSTISTFFTVTNGKTNTDDAIANGEYPLFDRSTSIKYSDKYLFDTEAVIIPGEGKEFIPRYYSGKFDLHQRAYAIFPKRSDQEVDVKFLYFWMNYSKAYLTKMAVGSTVKSLRLYMLNDFPIKIPPISTQIKIGDILSSIDEDIQKTDQIIQKSEQLKDGLMNDLLNNKSKSNQWKNYTLGDLCNFTTGKLNSNQAVINGKYPFFTCAQETFAIDRFSFDCKAVLLAGNNAAGIYSVKYFEGKFDAYQRTYVITAKDESILDYYFLKEVLNIRLNMLKDYSVGTNTKFLTIKLLLNIKVSLPPINVQKEISYALSTLEKKINLENKRRSELTNLKSSLMYDIFNQKVQIN